MRFWSWWTAPSCHRGKALTVCVHDGRDQQLPSLHSLGSWKTQVQEGQEITTDHLFSWADDRLHYDPVLGGGSSVPDDDGIGEDGLSDGVVHRHCLLQVKCLQLQQEVHPRLSLLDPSWRPGWWCWPQNKSAPQSRPGNHIGLQGHVGLGLTWSRQPSPLSLEISAPSCFDCTRSSNGQSPICRQTNLHQGWVQWGWCHLKFQDFDRLMTGGTVLVVVQGVEQRWMDAALWWLCAQGVGVKNVIPRFTCCLLSDRKSGSQM